MISIIGAGVAGLTCGAYLKKNKIPFTIYEKESHPGGRIQTIDFEGHQLDIGFQVFNPGYPEVKKLLSPWKLGLKKFHAGAKVWNGDQFVELIDPRRNPTKIFQALKSDIGIFRDRLKILKLIRECKKLDLENLTPANQTTFDFLHGYGFSDAILEKFFFPFFKGVFLEKDLKTDANFMKFVFSMLSKSYVTLPKRGMRAIPEQLAKLVGKKNIKFNYEVQKIENKTLVFTNGAKVPTEHLVLATEPSVTSDLLGSVNRAGKRSSVTYYFSTSKKYDKFLYLLNDSERVNQVAFLSEVQKSYSSSTLISATCLGGVEVKPEKILEDLRKFFGDDVNDWHFVKSIKVAFSLPNKFSYGTSNNELGGVYLIGDYLEDPSLNGAMKSGRLMAEKFIKSS